jgi:hypothetical protein
MNFVPLIKSINLLELDKPIKLTIDSKSEGGVLWWKYTPFIPKIQMDPRNGVSVVLNHFDNPFMAYLFSQTFFTIYMYNKMDFDNPLKFYVESETNSFYYFINQGEILYIPLLIKHNDLNVLLTHFNELPVLKIQVTKQIPNYNGKRHGKKRKRN